MALATLKPGNTTCRTYLLGSQFPIPKLCRRNIPPAISVYHSPSNLANSPSSHKTRYPIIAYHHFSKTDLQETFILSQPRIWWDMYHDRPTFSLVKWSEDDVDEYRGGLETKEGVHAVSPCSIRPLTLFLFLSHFISSPPSPPPWSHSMEG